MPNNSSHLEIQDLISTLDFKQDGFANKLIFQDDHSKTILFAFQPDQGLKEHSAPCSVAIHFLSGKATLTIDGISHIATTNSYYRLPSKLLHSIQAHEPTHMLLTLFKVQAIEIPQPVKSES